MSVVGEGRKFDCVKKTIHSVIVPFKQRILGFFKIQWKIRLKLELRFWVGEPYSMYCLSTHGQINQPKKKM